MNIKIENQFGHGAIPLNSVHRWFHRKMKRTKLAKGIDDFDWSIGYDVRDTIGPILIKNQGDNDSCGGQSGSYFLEIQRRLQNIQEGDCSAKSIYAPIAYPRGGTTISDLETQIGAKGCNLEKDIPSQDVGGNPLPESSISNRSFITPVTLQDALGRAGYLPVDVTVDIDDVAEAIHTHGVVIWEIKGQNGHTPGWLSSTPQPPVPNNGNPLFAHFMCCIGAKMINGQKTIICLESMGTQTGDNGIQYFTENYFDSGFITDCFTFFFDKNITVNQNNMSMWAGVVRWFRNFWGL